MDRDQWLADAATENGLGSPYKLGDADIDGVVDGQDFIAWNAAKFTSDLLWSKGDFNADGFVDGQDFICGMATSSPARMVYPRCQSLQRACFSLLCRLLALYPAVAVFVQKPNERNDLHRRRLPGTALIAMCSLGLLSSSTSTVRAEITTVAYSGQRLQEI